MPFSTNYLANKIYWQEQQASLLEDYQTGSQSYFPGVLPENLLQWPVREVLRCLQRRFGIAAIQEALDPQHTVPGPHQEKTNPQWLQTTNMVGINIRTIGDFWQVVKYTLSLPKHQDSVHLLPFWEPGVVASLYGKASWHINPAFFSQEWYGYCPQLDSPSRQLKALVNLLHLMGKSVGLDVIPHTDRYSEITLANPYLFEWLQRKDVQIIRHEANLHVEVQEVIFAFLQEHGTAHPDQPLPNNAPSLFGFSLSEEQRLLHLFGLTNDQNGRTQRRDLLVQWLYDRGFEPVPATMAPPYRGLEVDPNPQAKTVDHRRRIWRDYRITKPEKMSRVFGPLTRYKLYGREGDNRDWGIDFSQPRYPVWEYVIRHFKQIQQAYSFDFMRGDMSHVQMRPEGVPAQAAPYYDLHQAIRRDIRKQAPHFGYFAETFLAPDSVMAFGSEVDHLDLSEADTTLGDLQSMVPGSPSFLQAFRWYIDLHRTRRFKPSFTMMTGDKDDPRFDAFYLHANAARYFTGIFLTDWPSYMGLGFECRDQHLQPAPNEHYTKLYVFQIQEGPKATNGPYRWGQNVELFEQIARIRSLGEELLPSLEGATTQWLLPPDATGFCPYVAWTQTKPEFLFVVNFADQGPFSNIKIPAIEVKAGALDCVFSLGKEPANTQAFATGQHIQLHNLPPGTCRVYRWPKQN
ncbi:MAG: hypothetical protein AAGH79_00615 [Bacteroidota bacterium]